MNDVLTEFASPRKSIAWANEGINDLHTIIRGFFARVKTEEVTELDPDTGNYLFKVKLSETIPLTVEKRAFEALQHARNSFDQSLFAACAAIGKRPRSDVHFPWRTSPSDLEGTFQNRKCMIPVEFWDVLRRQEPYGRGQGYAGGDDIIREIARIANRKHTVGTTISGFVHGARLPDTEISGGCINIPAPRWDSKKNEMTLAIYSGGVNIKNNYSLAFSVIFDEAPALQGVAVTDGLQLFTSKANAVLEDLEREARKVRG